MAYSPLSRGFITGELRNFEDLKEDDMRRLLPRFQGENFKKNVDIVDKLGEIAKEKNCTVSQLAIAWKIAKGALPIPGTKRVKYLEENVEAINIKLTKKELEQLDEVSPESAVYGGRY
ncbi:aldo/keto reductase [Peribacillus simplex]|uniref:aldo/keto reductase n=1 Tax=Peribacillus simplex TaxID=1478 RepID=UPI0038095D1F